VQRLAARLGASVSPSKLRSPPLQTRSSYRSLPSHCKTGVIQALEQSCIGPRETLGIAERAFVEGGGCACKMLEVGPAICQPRAASTWSVEYPPSSVNIEEMQAMGCFRLLAAFPFNRRATLCFGVRGEQCAGRLHDSHGELCSAEPLAIASRLAIIGFADIRN
jgi:hypothetical protein